MPRTDTPVKDKLAESPRADERFYPCPICGNKTPRSRKYCSDGCRQSAHRVQMTCPTCETGFSLIKARYEQNLRRGSGKMYCSIKCAARDRWSTTIIKVTCPTCDKAFSLSKSRYGRRMRQNKGKLYCSRKCVPRGRDIKGKLLEFLKTHPKDGKYVQAELASVFGCSRENIRRIRESEHLEAYITGQEDHAHFCPACGAKIESHRTPSGNYKYPKFCCSECHKKSHRIQLTCHTCNRKFEIKKSDYEARRRRRKLWLWFCSCKCHGKYLGEQYGFGKYPEHVMSRRHELKWDRNKIKTLYGQGYKPKDVHEILGIPYPTIGIINKALGIKFKGGRKRKYDYEKTYELADNGFSAKEISQMLTIPYSAVYAILKKQQKEKQTKGQTSNEKTNG